ncbi:Vacuolar membrane protein-like protein [Hapsidospora chrysogenum ATCC 11550]|uniref:Vacuolar membrane protein-like protein n=1 Tax=Hapsidospora chrysogenum (strain ATCC 11550 / CBS 779.69 / DSM 880 / IAM 14645 / JCM 23072 / IMI 49137) TaxID=857340 RepID=A0A086TD37_HAPC1|nr:Vacuolar membrane protein-like protein [Hapsidospora chrysogenum ATCC 11550]
MQPDQDATAVAAGVDGPTATTLLDAAVTMASATFIAAAKPTDSAMPPMGEPEGECRLMGPFALLVQAALGALALLSLVYKRWRERPQRPVKIWLFDVSKQVFGSVLVHIANIFMSLLTSGRFSIEVEAGAAPAAGRFSARDDDPYTPNPCSFYLLNLAIDTTIGIPILIGLLKLITKLFALTPFGRPAESIQSGYYGNPPRVYWWLKQSVIYFIGLFGMKIVVLLIFIVFPWISHVGDWALAWTEGNERLQIAFVMMIFPLIMNALQYYIIDSFIKQKEGLDHHQPLASEDLGERRRLHRGGSGRRSSSSEDEEEEEEEEEGQELLASGDSEDDDDAKKTPTPRSFRRQAAAGMPDEYDPQKDGDAGTVVGSSSSSGHYEPNKSVPPELFPKE